MTAITERDEMYGPCECCGDLGESARDPEWGNELLCLHCQPCFGCGEMGGDCDLHECQKPVKEHPMSERLPVHHVSEPSIILAALVRHAKAVPDPNPFPRFRLWSWWPRARHT